jgi:hypothetical protein
MPSPDSVITPPEPPVVIDGKANIEAHDYAEFEIGHHQVPWFLWLFFALIVSWASISWIKFFGY